ncbi:PREDICTED: receptor-like kinase TMK2 [Camelina sativa]|uniref:Receptor-like kinase TMK2 n=1 Tax=Camelina sativa TaxID=90675 RepID=A0ABM1RS31_CAMSA|nr:PREDICTED: receptor-like kinase TMK2 [Camelina sativa]
MSQGSLRRHLFQWEEEGLKPLEWTTQLTIALDVAKGVEYLHTLALQCQSYIHKDLEPANILLGDYMRAKVSDFGLVRATEEGRASIRTKCVGTAGYIAPEYQMTGRVTTKVDVFSFGVILRQLVTGQEALDENRSEYDHHIFTWFRKFFIDNNSIGKAIDETIELNEETCTVIDEVAKLAIHYCAKEPARRPEMSYIVSMLTSIIVHWAPSEIEEEDEDDTSATISEIIKGWKEPSGVVVGDELPGYTVLGCNNVIGHHVVVGVKCQDLKYKNWDDAFFALVTTIVCTEIKFPTGSIFHQLVYLEPHTNKEAWWNLLSIMLDSSPQLQFLELIDSRPLGSRKDLVAHGTWNQPNNVAECLLHHLETFVRNGYKEQLEESNIFVSATLPIHFKLGKKL